MGRMEQLSGVPPEILVAIDAAESGGQGGYVNSEGYGGWFGLAAGTEYPGGILTEAELTGTTPAAFSAQAIIVGAEFARLLTIMEGAVDRAEVAYQGGSQEGLNIMRKLGVPMDIPWPPPEANMLFFIKEPNGQVFWFIPGGPASYWRLVPAVLAANIPPSWIMQDPTGG